MPSIWDLYLGLVGALAQRWTMALLRCESMADIRNFIACPKVQRRGCDSGRCFLLRLHRLWTGLTQHLCWNPGLELVMLGGGPWHAKEDTEQAGLLRVMSLQTSSISLSPCFLTYSGSIKTIVYFSIWKTWNLSQEAIKMVRRVSFWMLRRWGRSGYHYRCWHLLSCKEGAVVVEISFYWDCIGCGEREYSPKGQHQ